MKMKIERTSLRDALIVLSFCIWMSACTAYGPSLSDLYDDDFRIRANTYPLHEYEGFDALSIRIIHDDPEAAYASPRTILLSLEPGTPLAWTILPDTTDKDDLLMRSHERVYFLMRIEAETDRRTFAGPFDATDKRVSELIDAESPLPGFEENLQADVFALIRDLYAVHGDKHNVDEKPFTLNWHEAAEAIRLFDQSREQGRSLAYVGYQRDVVVVWIPVVTVENATLLTSGAGGFVAEVNRSNAVVTQLWIDLN